MERLLTSYIVHCQVTADLPPLAVGPETPGMSVLTKVCQGHHRRKRWCWSDSSGASSLWCIAPHRTSLCGRHGPSCAKAQGHSPVDFFSVCVFSKILLNMLFHFRVCFHLLDFFMRKREGCGIILSKVLFLLTL